MNFSQGNHKLRLKNVYERDHNSVVQLRSSQFSATVILAIF